MARTIAEIQQEIIDAKNADATLAALNSTSKVAIWRLWSYITAVAIWTLENLFDFHKAEVAQIIDDMRPAYIKWYVEQSKAFQLGYDLVQDDIVYDNTGLDENTVEASKVVKYAAANGIFRGVRIKVATIINNELNPLPAAAMTAFEAYMNRIKPAGIRLYFLNEIADSLKLNLTVYYDAMVLDINGKRIDGTSDQPVQDAIDMFLKNQPFNGLFVIMKLVDALQGVDGVVIPSIISAQAQYGSLPYQDISVSYLPDAGYLRIVSPLDLTLNFIPHEPV